MIYLPNDKPVRLDGTSECVSNKTPFWIAALQKAHAPSLGRRPFVRATLIEELSSIISETEHPAPISRYIPEAPIALGLLILKALEKNRDKRYQTFGEALVDLRELKRSLEVEPRTTNHRYVAIVVSGALALMIAVLAGKYSGGLAGFTQPSAPVNNQGSSPADGPTIPISSPLNGSGQSPPAEPKPIEPAGTQVPASTANRDEERFRDLLKDARNSEDTSQFGKACGKYLEALRAVPASYESAKLQ